MGIEVIARDWDRPGWCGSFYPEDLPEDWRLTYFANAFEAVLVPALAWQSVPWEHLAAWREDVPQRFRFYLELAQDQAPATLARAAQALGERFAGSVAAVCPGPTVVGANADPDAEATRTWSAWGRDGTPILARRLPDALLSEPPAAVAWLRGMAAEARSRPALAVFGEGPADSLTRWSQLVLLAGLA
jgi:hypothetical protein